MKKKKEKTKRRKISQKTKRINLKKRKKKIRKTKKRKLKKRKRRSKKIKKKDSSKHLRKSRKIKVINFKVQLKKIKFPHFNKQKKQLKKLNFQNVMGNIFKILTKTDEKVVGFIYKPLKSFINYRKKSKIEKLKKIEKERKEKERQINAEEQLRRKLKAKELREEVRIAKARQKDIKTFLRKEQAEIRKEQSLRQKKFLAELNLQKRISKYAEREAKELQNLERIAFKEERSDYSELQSRIEKLKEKYKDIRTQAIRERVEALGVGTYESDDRDALLEKEKQYTLERQKIENCLESFFRASASLCFQINKRYIPRHLNILRCIDRRFESSEIYIRWDDAAEEDWLLLIYIKNNSPKEGIIIEDRTDPEKNVSHEYKTTQIFKASDMMVDSLIRLLEKEREKKAS